MAVQAGHLCENDIFIVPKKLLSAAALGFVELLERDMFANSGLILAMLARGCFFGEDIEVVVRSYCELVGLYEGRR